MYGYKNKSFCIFYQNNSFPRNFDCLFNAHTGSVQNIEGVGTGNTIHQTKKTHRHAYNEIWVDIVSSVVIAFAFGS